MSSLKLLTKNTERELPAWCNCMPWDWDCYETIPPACNSFKDSGNGYCKFCQHTEECHSKKLSLHNLVPEGIYEMMARHVEE